MGGAEAYNSYTTYLKLDHMDIKLSLSLGRSTTVFQSKILAIQFSENKILVSDCEGKYVYICLDRLFPSGIKSEFIRSKRHAIK